MTEQHISFTSDEEMDESHFITYGFSSSLSPLSSPKRNQSMHGKDDNHDIPVDGACFSSLSFDWSVGIAEEAQPAAADFSLQRSANRSKDVQSLLPSNYRTSCSRDASSWPWESLGGSAASHDAAKLSFVIRRTVFANCSQSPL